MSKKCDGCADNIIIIDAGVICKDFNKDGSCPCTECVVKTMCEDSCDPTIKWTNDKIGRKFDG